MELATGFKQVANVVQSSNCGDESFTCRISEMMKNTLSGEVMVVDKYGYLLETTTTEHDFLTENKNLKGNSQVDARFNEQLKSVYETRANISLKNVLTKNYPQSNFSAVVVPLLSDNVRIGTLAVLRDGKLFDENETVFCELCGSILSMYVFFSRREEMKSTAAKEEAVKAAMSTLSYSELASVVHILKELDTNEGRVVASHIADKIGVTRSVIVNAIRKLESAGVLESRSLGMKGTYIRITNPKLKEEIRAYAK